MASSGSGVFKRVISNPDEMVKAERDGKMTKVEGADFAATKDNGAMMIKKLALGDDNHSGGNIDAATAAADAAIEGEIDGLLNNTNTLVETYDDADPDTPLSTISHVHSRGSATHSTLSAGSTDGSGDNVASMPKSKLTRQVSHDSNSSSEGARQTSVSGNWGWFEDVHAHESSNISESTKKMPGLMDNDDASGNAKGGGANNKKKKKGGLLQMGLESMHQALFSIIEPMQRGE